MPEDGEHGADLEGWFQQDQDTIFDRLSEKAISWKIYFHDIPQSICLTHQRRPERVARYFPINQFDEDARGPEADFPAFCFIEPDYNGATENDDHPPHDVMKAQKLLADVYNALRANAELWASTLLVVLYDEHGGFYDHVEPPSYPGSPFAVPPEDAQPDWEYTFDRLGIRVPALLVSSFVEQGFHSTPFDHTSLLKYLIEKWTLDGLGNRATHVNSIGNLIRPIPRTGTVERIDLAPNQLPDPNLEEEAVKYITIHHKALALLGRRLRWELLKESPLTYAWVFYVVEVVLHYLFGLGNSIVFRLTRWRAKKSWVDFRERKKRQAIPLLADRIRGAARSDKERQHAIETLGLIAGQKFYHAADPVSAAEAWLRHAQHWFFFRLGPKIAKTSTSLTTVTEDRPRFRGPTGLGYTEEKNLPVMWGGVQTNTKLWQTIGLAFGRVSYKPVDGFSALLDGSLGRGGARRCAG
jgi:hypothetical protein